MAACFGAGSAADPTRTCGVMFKKTAQMGCLGTEAAPDRDGPGAVLGENMGKHAIPERLVAGPGQGLNVGDEAAFADIRIGDGGVGDAAVVLNTDVMEAAGV